MCLHYCSWLPSYNVHASEQKAKGFDYHEWYNKDCDAHFRRKIDNGEIIPIEFENEAKMKSKILRLDSKLI